MSIFADRRHAGRVLAAKLAELPVAADLVVLALPRGGVPVAYEIARSLHAPLDVLVVRKLGVPGREELAMGAIASGGLCVLNAEVVRQLAISQETIRAAVRTESLELERRDRAYRGERAPVDVSGKTVVLVDDGLATGSTMRVAIRALRQRSPLRVIASVPVAASETCAALSTEADEVVCALTPRTLQAVGNWYEDFSQTSDDEVRELLEALRRGLGQDEPASARAR